MKKRYIASTISALILSTNLNAASISVTVGAFDGLAGGPFPTNYDLNDFVFNLNGEQVISASLTGIWGDTDTFCCSTAAGELYVDGLLVETNNITSSPGPAWSYNFLASEFSLLADGHLDFTAVQTGPTYLRLGETTLRIETSPIPLPAAVWLFGSGLLGLLSVARNRSRFS